MAANESTIIHQGIQVPPGKQTALGLYVTAKEAYEMWKADPEKVKGARRAHGRGVRFPRSRRRSSQYSGGFSKIPMAR